MHYLATTIRIVPKNIPHLLHDITAAHRTEKLCKEREKSFAEMLEEISQMKEGEYLIFCVNTFPIV
jgi:hypothetical protein